MRWFVASDGTRSSLVILEREKLDTNPSGVQITCSPSEYDNTIDAVGKHPFDWLLVEFAYEHLTIRSSKWGTAPVYVRSDGAEFTVSWDIYDLLDDEVILDGAVLKAFLQRESLYTSRTMVSGVSRVTANSSAIWNGKKIDVIYPPIAKLADPRTSVNEQAMAAHFLDGVELQLTARPLDPNKLAVEISGGMDSAICALVAARAFGDHQALNSYAVMFSGEMGRKQRERRLLILKRGNFNDLSLPAQLILPYNPGSCRWLRKGAWVEDENYPEIFEFLYVNSAGLGCDTVLTGLGGDELYPTFAGEDPEFEQLVQNLEVGRFVFAGPNFKAIDSLRASDIYPLSTLLHSAWISAAGRARRLLSKGLWPLYPFHAPEIAHLTFQLPASIRKGRKLHSMALEQLLGCSVFSKEYEKESFSSYLADGMISYRQHIYKTLSEGFLARSGVIDLAVVKRVLFDQPLEPGSIELDSLFFTINAELSFAGIKVAKID